MDIKLARLRPTLKTDMIRYLGSIEVTFINYFK